MLKIQAVRNVLKIDKETKSNLKNAKTLYKSLVILGLNDIEVTAIFNSMEYGQYLISVKED